MTMTGRLLTGYPTVRGRAGREHEARRLGSGLEPPVLIPGGIRPDPLTGHRDLDHVRPVLARDGLHATPERGLQILHRGDALAVHALGARQPHIVGGGGAEEESRVFAL